MSTETITDQFTELMEHFDDEVPCGHWAHETQPRFHQGVAEWMYFQHCPGCGDHAAAPVCDQFRSALASVSHTSVRCATCDQRFDGNEWVFRFEEL